MAENTENVKETKESGEVSQEQKYEEYKKSADGAEVETSKGKIHDVINKAKDELEELRFEKFLESKGLSKEEYKNKSDLEKDADLGKEFAEYKLDPKDEKVQEIYQRARYDIIKVTDDRNNTLNELYGNKEGKDIVEKEGKVQQLLNEVDKKIQELEGKEGKEEELKKLQDIKAKIGDKKENTGLFKTLNEAAGKQMSVRRIAIEDFSKAMDEKIIGGGDMVRADQTIKDALGELDKDGNIISKKLEDISKDDEKNKEQQNKEEQVAEKEGKIPPEVAAQLAKQMAGQPVAGNGNIIAEDAPEEDIPEEPQVNYAEILGYNMNNGFTYKSSREMLQVFLGEKVGPTGVALDDKTRVELLSSPEGSRLIQNALVNLNDKNGRFAYLKKVFINNKLNDKVKNMLENQLPAYLKEQEGFISDKDKERIQEDLGANIDLTQDIQEQLNGLDEKEMKTLTDNANSLSKSYTKEIEELRNKLKDKNLSDEDREVCKKELNNTIEKNKIFNNTIGNHLKVYKFGQTVDDATLGNINMDSLPEPTERTTDGIEGNMDRKLKSIQGMTKSPVEAELSSDKRKEDEQKKKSVGEQEIDGPDAPGQS